MASASIVEQPQIGSLAKIIWLETLILVCSKALNAAHLNLKHVFRPLSMRFLCPDGSDFVPAVARSQIPTAPPLIPESSKLSTKKWSRM